MKKTTSRRKVAFIGASLKFVHQAIQDFINCRSLEDTDCFLYDIDQSAVELECDFISKMIRQLNSSMTVSKCESREVALSGADYVVTSLLVGGMDIAEAEDEICGKYGIRHTVGDTIGPMCAGRCLRMVPLMLDIAADMRKLCPDAYLLSPTNPMAVTMEAVSLHGGVKCVGICHGTHFLVETIAKAYAVSSADVFVNIVGVNHLGFSDKITVRGEDLPVKKVIADIKEVANAAFDDPAGHKDRFLLALEFARRIGRLPNNGDHHFIEFFPWFLAPSAFDANGINRYGVDNLLHSPNGRREIKAEAERKLRELTYEVDFIPNIDRFSGEHINDIILGLEGRCDEMVMKNLHLNILNDDSVPNLPHDALLELSVEFKNGEIKGVENPPVDPFVYGKTAILVAENKLLTNAAVKHDKSQFIQALHLDPLIREFDTIPDLADDLWELNKPFFKAEK